MDFVFFHRCGGETLRGLQNVSANCALDCLFDISGTDTEGTFLAGERMYQLEERLNPKEFLRVSKSVIIARGHVKKIRPTLSMKYILTMTNGTLVDVTRSYYSDFRRFFGI